MESLIGRRSQRIYGEFDWPSFAGEERINGEFDWLSFAGEERILDIVRCYRAERLKSKW